VLLLVRAYNDIPPIPAQDPCRISLDNRLNTGTNITFDWSIFQSRDGNVPSLGTSSSARFRLAGTFFEYLYENNKSSAGEIRRAVIDDLRSGNQVIVREGEKIEDTSIVKIYSDRVIIRDNSGIDEQLWLTFSGFGANTNKSNLSTNEINQAGTGQIAGTDKFGGKQIGESRWVFSREKLLEYYKSLRDEPDRLVKVFDSLKPVYDGKTAGGIGGYRLGVEGEGEFFKSVGLKEGDVVRSVNNMQMTSRRRAEYFIGEFVSDRANAFVLDVERGGKQQKLIYEVR
jgi:hypothetical protein